MPGAGFSHYDVPAVTEQAQLGYQGYIVYQSADYTDGLGVYVTRCVAGSEMHFCVIVRGGEYAASGVPMSVVVRKQGVAPVIAGAGDLTYGQYVGAAGGNSDYRDGRGVHKDTDGDYVIGRCIKGATAGNVALVELAEIPFRLRKP